MKEASLPGLLDHGLLSSAQSAIGSLLGREAKKGAAPIRIARREYVPEVLSELSVGKLGYLLCRTSFLIENLGPVDVDGITVTARRSLSASADYRLSFVPKVRHEEPFYIDVKKWIYQSEEAYGFSIRKGAMRNTPTEIEVTCGLENLGSFTESQEVFRTRGIPPEECEEILKDANRLLTRAIVYSLVVQNRRAAEDYAAQAHQAPQYFKTIPTEMRELSGTIARLQTKKTFDPMPEWSIRIGKKTYRLEGTQSSFEDSGFFGHKIVFCTPSEIRFRYNPTCQTHAIRLTAHSLSLSIEGITVWSGKTVNGWWIEELHISQEYRDRILEVSKKLLSVII